ncbi:hypothetical protein [Sphingomonas profundi]|uniref:hypothetical protein n=1 Tax=Alterirhizorhabdus profundi TaxID=2681549 RepID=UPI0012E79668|nr:hypothetical protein [Sphingomonas profundi]
MFVTRRRAAALLLFSLAAGCGGRPADRAGPAPSQRPDGIPLGALPRQALGAGECGLFLWKAAPSARLVLMAKSGPPTFARILLDGRPVDLPRLGGGDFASEPTARYGDGRITLSLELSIENRRGLSDGAVVAGSLGLERTDGDGFVLPVTGLLACG